MSGSVATEDAALPQLAELLDPDSMTNVLSRVCGKATRVERAEIVRYRPGRRCTIRYVVSNGGASPPLYAKTYASERHALVYRTLRALSAARACGPDVALPEPLGHVPGLRLVVQRAVIGEPATRRLLAGDEQLAKEIAAALRALHGSTAALEREHALSDELAVLARRLTELPNKLRREAGRCFTTAAEAAGEFSWRCRPIHRDLYHDQIVVDDGRLGMLDLDDASMSEPAVDVANFSAHLRLLAYDRPAASSALRRVARAVRSRYEELGGELEPRLVAVLEATTLLRLSAIHLARGGEELAALLIACSGDLLRGSGCW